MSIPRNEVKIETFRSKGKGGQNVNKVETAVRVIHLPTGIVATCQDERSQEQNKQRALATLEERVNKHRASIKRQQIERLRDSLYRGRVRTYNFVTQDVVDYRTKKRTSRLQDVLDGNLDLVR